MSQPGMFDVYGKTRRASSSAVNEDQFLIAQLQASLLLTQSSLQLDDDTRVMSDTRGRLLLVAGGLGEHDSGKAASTIAVNFTMDSVLNMMSWYTRLSADHEDDLEADLKAALERCQSAVTRLSKGNPDREDMGTSLTMAYALWPRLYVVHAGSSRCYVLRRAELERITTDHTLRDDAAAPRFTKVLWNAIGAGTDSVIPDVYKVRLEIGDAIVLCTEGLTKHVGEAELTDALLRHSSAEDACNELVAMARSRGADDHATAVVAYVRSLDDEAPTRAVLETASDRSPPVASGPADPPAEPMCA